jgi:hypothetical protein
MVHRSWLGARASLQVTTIPEFYIFGGLKDVEEALGPQHVASPSWSRRGGYDVTDPGPDAKERMQAHRNKWDRILNQLSRSD